MLPAGTRVGPYEITGPLGQGGMGVVYRARDSKLQRDVAIKVLPALFVSDPDRIVRFEREAQALAALNHPNIAQVYGVFDLAEGAGPGGALVMELVEGEDLSGRLQRGAIDVDECLPVARQIAEALEAAHERGIVHRDLKPANITLRPDGVVKVLDFGLAKATDTDASGVHPQDSPTFTSPARATEFGVVLGTAAYMAPEQAKGKAVDKRADIWAFGVVLFEMLTGRTLFAGETVSETVAAVLRDDIPLEQLPGETPLAVRRLIERCLERDPKLRLRDIGEARITLTSAHRGEAQPVVATTAHAPARRYAGIFGLIALAAALGLSAGWLAFRSRSTPALSMHFTFDAEQAGDGAIIPVPSPDGRHVAVAGGSGVWVRSMDSTEMRQLVRDQQPHELFWSPDSQWIAIATTTALLKVPREGGEVVRIADISKLPGPFNPMGGGVWLSGDRIVFTTAFTGLLEVPAGGGEPRTLFAPASDGEDFHGVTALPSGGFITAAHDGAQVDKLVALRDGARTTVLEMKGEDLAAPQYSPTGHLLFRRMTTDGLWALRFDERTLRPAGEPFLVISGVAPRVSADGRMLVTASTTGTGETPIALVAAGAKSEQRVGPAAAMATFGAPALSPDGQRLAVVSSQAGVPSAWIHPIAQGLATQLTDGAPAASVSWLPSGRGLVVVRGATWCLSANCFSIEHHGLDGSAVRTIASGWSPDVSPDGTVIVYAKRQDAEWDLVAQPFDRPGEPTPFQGGAGWQFGARFSPNGRYVAYMSMDSGRGEVYVAAYPSGEKRRVTADGGYWPRWSADGKRLYYAKGRGVMVMDVSTAGTFSVGAPTEVLPQGTLALMPNTRWPAPFDVSGDGKQFLVHRPPGEGETPKPLVHVLLDWAR